MATTRSSTPDGDVSEPASPQLSPRSKLRAELAAIDDQYPKETPNGPIDVKALFESIDRTRGANDDATRAQDAPQDVNEDETEDEDEEEDIIQPRGRLAARMLAGRARDAPAPELSRPTKIPPKHASEPIHKASPTEHASEENQSEEDDDDEVTALPRRRLNKRVRGTTPESAAAEAEPPSSPSLFVSQSPRNSFTAAVAEYNSNSDSDDEVPADLTKSDRFKALVAKKRAERLAKEAEEERKREERARRIAEQMPADSDVEDDDASDISDDAGGRKLTQDVSRPARKASKKALEEMNRETQRLSRSLQLAHEAKTKKKITKASLFERFNFMANKAQNQPAAAPTNLASSSRPTTPGSGHHTEVEVVEGNTPPSSPPGAPKLAPGPSAGPGPETVAEEDEDDELPSILTALKRPQQKVEGKGKDVEVASKPHGVKEIELPKAKRQVRVRLPTVQTNLVTLDSGDELEITKPKKGRLDAVFDKIPEKKAQEPMSMSILRHLAHLSSPPKADSSRGRNTKPSMTSGELQMTLQQRARAQAKLERERRLEYLRSKGVVVQSTEQRERERQQVEDIVDRARQEVEEIMQRERDDAKQARKERRMNGEDDALDWDDSDDESFKGSEEDKPDEAEAEELEFSGSEDEGDEDEDNNEKSRATNLLFQEEAEEDESEEEIPKDIEQDAPENADDEDDSPGSLLSALKTRRPKKRARVISDDEDEDAIEATPRPKTAYIQSPAARDADSPILPKSVLRSATKNFIPGLPIANAAPAGLGLTQIFAGTMDESQASQVNGSPQEFMPTLGEFPDSQFSATAEQSQNDGMVLNSQPTEAEDTQTWDSQGVQLHYSQSQVHGFDSFMQSEDTQFSQTIEPTQDGGFQDFSPLKQRFVEAPQSTVDTVLLGDNAEETTAHDSPLVKKHTRLRRRGDYATSASSLPPTEIPGSQSTMPPALSEADKPDGNAFRLMEKAARREKRRQKKFDKKKSKATEMIEEQAEESEDEYAGLGGMDGEDSSEDDEELRKEMIDDTAGNNVDEAKLAGFFA
ncbi:hypothetical protein GGR56DRAFT_651626 [Xylariaceae sp. FL0804]|nr:hypothetical protein GGR56DRAFT_651626 [Xylariaceae sp. FL0804]